MEVRIEITVGDKIIADSYREEDDCFRFRRYPGEAIKAAQKELMSRMSEAIERAITDQLTKYRTPAPPTSYPTHRATGRPFDVIS